MHLNYSLDTSLFVGAILVLGSPIAALIVAPLVEARLRSKRATNSPFSTLKLRSMRLDSQSDGGPQRRKDRSPTAVRL
jgi:hypothetical protein